MHSESLIEIARRKERMVARAARQRAAVAAEACTLEKPLAIVDRGVAIVQFCKTHPLLLVAGAVGVLILGRRNMAAWAGRGWVAWRAWRSLSSWVEGSGR